jgi:hypothetical protein
MKMSGLDKTRWAFPGSHFTTDYPFFSEIVESIGALRMKPLISCLFSVLVIFCLVSCSSSPSDGLGEPVVMRAESESVDKAVVGEVVDIARYGRRSSGRHFIGIEWEEPRDIYEVRISGIDRRVAESLRLEWWGSVWPNNGTGGWMRLDDAWNGQWVKVTRTKKRTVSVRDFGGAKRGAGKDFLVRVRFPPLTKGEWKNALNSNQYPNKKDPVFRRTLKVRLVADGRTIEPQAHLKVLGNSHWREASFDIETRHTHNGMGIGRIEVTNGILLSIESLPAPRLVKVSGTKWIAQSVAGGSSGVCIKILYADNKDLNSNDITRVTVRFGKEPGATGFSFVPQDVLKEGAMRLPSFGTLISETSRGLTLVNDPGPVGPAPIVPSEQSLAYGGISGADSVQLVRGWSRPVRKRLRERPEMTRETAMAGIPRLSPARWVPLGVPSARQEFFVGPNGDWKISALSLNTDAGRDAKRWVFKKNFGKERQWDEFAVSLDTRQEPKFDGGDRKDVRRYLEDGHLPLIHVEWQSGPLRYHHALTATILLGDYGDDVSRRGDETVVLLSKLQVTNTGDITQLANLNLRYSIPAEYRTPITLQEDGVITVQRPDCNAVCDGLTALRGMISMEKPTGGGAANWTVLPGSGPESPAILHWQEKLRAGETRSVYFKAPFVELLDARELNRLKEISFEQQVRIVLDYWRRRLAEGMQIEVPDEALNNFYKANLWHNAITTDRDPCTGLYNQGVATVRYRVFANETVMIARSMDMRGEHTEAERFLEPMLYYQGKEALKGRFSTKEGVFHGAGDYTHGEYAMNHGFVLWGVAEHYLITRDRAYLERVAPKLIKGCDFLISERTSTMNPKGSIYSPIHGLTPASSLEDVVEYQYWFATNAYFYLGMKRVAQALADIGHPQSRRIAAEAEKYRKDIEASVREAMTRSAVVPLRDGNYIPYVPSRVYQWRHLTEGWIREALYCSLHLAVAEVVSPDDPLITWMLDDLEDNIFFSWQSGYNVSDYEQRWFERGGITLQPCLLDTPIVYMSRNETAAALRAFWNTYALLIYPDVQCFAEWARKFGVGGGPVYKTSDESRFVMWLRQLLVWENGHQLWFARATPQEWLEDGKTIRIERAKTMFGTVDMVIHSEVSKGRILAQVSLPKRNPPSEVWLRLRHPQGRCPIRVSINGQPVEPERIVGADIRLVPGVKDLCRQGDPVKVIAEY